MDSAYAQKWVHLIAAAVVVLFGLGLSVNVLTSAKASPASKYLLYAVVGLSALYLLLSRSTYLPFLGETVFPCALLKEQTPENANYEMRIQLDGPGRKVLFWAAEPDTEYLQQINDWRKAYLGFHNAGVTVVGDDNTALLRVRKPQPYTVPVKGRLEAHIHYRVCGDNGMLGPVQTAFLNEPASVIEQKKDGKAEPFHVAPASSEDKYASAV